MLTHLSVVYGVECAYVPYAPYGTDTTNAYTPYEADTNECDVYDDTSIVMWEVSECIVCNV